MKRLALYGVLAVMTATAPRALTAQDEAAPRYRIGVRSMTMLSSMPLGKIAPAFDDLETGGSGLASPHASSFFFLTRLSSRIEAGVETFVATSSEKERTSVLLQGAGPVIEVGWGQRWRVGGGLQVGGIIVSATQAEQVAEESGEVREGSFYKAPTVFASPHLTLGRRFGNFELSLFGKYAAIAGVADGAQHFSTMYGGLSVARRFGQ